MPLAKSLVDAKRKSGAVINADKFVKSNSAAFARATFLDSEGHNIVKNMLQAKAVISLGVEELSEGKIDAGVSLVLRGRQIIVRQLVLLRQGLETVMAKLDFGPRYSAMKNVLDKSGQLIDPDPEKVRFDVPFWKELIASSAELPFIDVTGLRNEAILAILDKPVEEVTETEKASLTEKGEPVKTGFIEEYYRCETLVRNLKKIFAKLLETVVKQDQKAKDFHLTYYLFKEGIQGYNTQKLYDSALRLRTEFFEKEVPLLNANKDIDTAVTKVLVEEWENLARAAA